MTRFLSHFSSVCSLLILMSTQPSQASEWISEDDRYYPSDNYPTLNMYFELGEHVTREEWEGQAKYQDEEWKKTQLAIKNDPELYNKQFKAISLAIDHGEAFYHNERMAAFGRQ